MHDLKIIFKLNIIEKKICKKKKLKKNLMKQRKIF